MFPILALALMPYAATTPADVTFPAEGAATPFSVAYPAEKKGRFHRLDAKFRLRFTGPAEGAGLAFLSTAAYGEDGPAPSVARWEEPNLDRTFAIGFDTYDPLTQNLFDADGNIYNRPQHEVSLHWDGVEVANVVSPIAFEDGMPHNVAVSLHFVTAGVMVSVTIDGMGVYTDYFVIGPDAYRARLALGLDQGTLASLGLLPTLTPGTIPQPPTTIPTLGACTFDSMNFALSEHAKPDPSPTHVPIFAGANLNAAFQDSTSYVQLPAAGKPAERVILTLTLTAPPGGIDPWDRSGSIYAFDDVGLRYEILRFITPFGRGYRWRADVTDYQSLLHGRRQMSVAIDTWQGGWSVDVALDYYWGKPALEPFRVTNLWSGNWEYGNPADPIEARFVPRNVIPDASAKAAKVRLVVTGHGMTPNTDNAAEFMPATRTLTVSYRAFDNLLWKTDNYLNPCRPQAGTWKYDRAGWGPGSLVTPWDVDVTGVLQPGVPALIQYKPQSYVNANAGKSRAYYIVEGQLIEYR
jgi:hypothetical protein